MKKLALPMQIPRKSGRILDVGSGNNCLDIATHIVDLKPQDNFERGGQLETPEGKIFQQGSLESIPYPDKFFDFIHAAHVLEHVDSPAAAVKEMTRVAETGYVETPAPVMEQGAYFGGSATPGWEFHYWFVWTFPGGGTLYAKPKTARSMKEVCSCRRGQAYQKLARAYNLAEIDGHLPYNCKMTQLGWRDSIRFELWDEGQSGSGGEDCRCQFAAFFAWGKKYFATPARWRKRFHFWRKMPGAYRLFKSGF